MLILWFLISCILCFSKCDTYIIAGNIMLKDYLEISTYSFMEVINRKENKKIGTILFKVNGFQLKKPKILMEFFHVSFRKWLSKFGFKNLILEKEKNYIWKHFHTMKKPLRNRASKWFHVPPNAMISRCMLIAVFNSYCGKWKAFVKLTLTCEISIAK